MLFLLPVTINLLLSSLVVV